MLAPRLFVTGSSGGGGTPLPLISSLATSDYVNMSCLNQWRVQVDWTIDDPDNTNYKLKLVVNSTTLDDNLNCATGSYIYSTGQVGDTSLFDYDLSLTFTLQVIRRSDSVVMSSEEFSSFAKADS